MSELVDSELVIEVGKPAHGGYCLAHIDQGTVFVRFALPGEKVRIRIISRSEFCSLTPLRFLSPHLTACPASGRQLGRAVWGEGS